MADAYSGILGDVSLGGTPVAHVRRFTINEYADNQQYASSDTSGYKETAEGQRGWDGNMDVYSDDAVALAGGIVPGAKLACVFTTYTGMTLTGNLRVNTVENRECDVEGSGMAGMTVTFSGIGDLA